MDVGDSSLCDVVLIDALALYYNFDDDKEGDRKQKMDVVSVSHSNGLWFGSLCNCLPYCRVVFIEKKLMAQV